MNDPLDPNQTIDSSSVPADSLDAGLAAGFAQPAEGPRSTLDGSLRPLLLREAEGESAHFVKPNSDAMPDKSTTGDRYQLSGEIARGGMGAVLRGRDIDLGRDLAIKVLLEKHANNPSVARRFLEEAQIGGQLQHPGVVPVYDIGRFDDLPFFAMKLVKGKTLATLLSERADPTTDRPRFLSNALQVAQTLAYAHAKGVIHRDLKPANIMVGAFGEVQVMDWGLAKVLPEGGIADEEKASRQHNESEDVTTIRTARSGSAGSGADTEAGSLLGTPAYMPPEQANGDVALLDRRADVFGLGAILCAILTGKPPYVGRSAEEVRRKAANGDLADAQARLASCGAETELITLTKVCLSPEAGDRPKDARAVADALTAYLDGVQERLHQAELAEAEARARALEEAKRRRLTLALAATVLLALTLGGGGWLWVKADRDARQVQVAREVNDAMNQAIAFREQAKAAPTGSAVLFAQAREKVQRALALVENGPADALLTAQVRQLRAELDEEEKDRKLVKDLDEARFAQAELAAGESRFARERAVPLFREALRAYGLPAGKEEPAAVAAFIRQRPAVVRETLLATLDEWIELAAYSKIVTEPHLDWLQAVAVAIEPKDGLMRQLRAAREEKDMAKRRAALEKLAEEADLAKLPAHSLMRLAMHLQSVKAEASEIPLLRRAQQQYPADFWMNHRLGILLQEGRPPKREEAVRFLTAAVALRPESAGAYGNLGTALKDIGRVDEAIGCYHKAIQLEPKLAVAHTGLGLALVRKGMVDAAIACYHKAIELEPTLAAAHANLGFALAGKGEVDAAITCYHKAIQVNPKNAKVLIILGVALKDKGELDHAIASYKKAIELDPMAAEAHSNLGAALVAKGQVEAAITCYHKAIDLDPKDALAHYNLGVVLKDNGELEAAIACYKEAIALDPNHAPTHINLGAALKDKGELEMAISCYKKAIELDPKHAAAHNKLGLALIGKGQVDAAIACLRKAIEIDPTFAMAYTNLGAALASKGQVAEAITCYQKAIELDPMLAAAHTNLGNALKDKCNFDEAIVCYKKAIALDPKNAAGHYNLATALAGKGQLDEAITCYQKAIALDPKLAAAHTNLGLVLAGKGELDKAIALFRQAIAVDPTSARNHFNLANALDRKGQVDEAITSYRKANLLDLKNPAAHYGLGNALGRKGKLDEAIACFRQAIALDPKSPAYHYNLGNALSGKGRADAAIACFRQAIALDPKLAEAHCNLGSALASQGRFADALAAYKRGHELGSNQPGWRYPSAEWVRMAEAKAALEAKLPMYLKGEFQPRDNKERLGLAGVCQVKKLHHATAGLYAAAFAVDPKLATDLGAGHRYNAACSAALAAAGQGEDAAKLDEKEWASLRKQALDWLRADLVLLSRNLEAAPNAVRMAALQQLRHWLKDADLASIRDKDGLAKLPAEEREAFNQLWAEVAALLQKAEVALSKEVKP